MKGRSSFAQHILQDFFFKNNFSMGSVEEYAFCIEVARKLDLKLFKLFDSGIFIAGI